MKVEKGDTIGSTLETGTYERAPSLEHLHERLARIEAELG